ncbi:MAG: NAD(P)H-hydrate epimerase [Candidatus Omnitrophota bacterium]
MVPVSAEKMAEIDLRAQTEYGISQEALMEKAGMAVADAVLSDISRLQGLEILIVCGKGNNGGDGYVAARDLFSKAGDIVKLYTPEVEDIRDGAALTNFKRAVNSGIAVSRLSSLLSRLDNGATGSIIIDALLGTGYRGAMTGIYSDIAEKVNSSGARVYSVDVPSGLNATTGEAVGQCFNACKTITFGLPKTGFYSGTGPKVCGEIIVADIGFPEELVKEFL